ncbi:MAG: hypothetical protein AAF633_24720 [Chloroflexota bacterium]
MTPKIKQFAKLCAYAAAGCLNLFGLIALFGGNPVSPASAALGEATTALSPSQANVSATMNYQGVLRDAGGNLVNGEQDITVKLYNQPINGVLLYQAAFTGVTIRDGVFNVVLGDTVELNTGIFSQVSQLYIGITVAPDTVEMTPRQRLHPVPWAQRASSARRADSAALADNATFAATAATLQNGASVQNLTVVGPLTMSTDTEPWTIRQDFTSLRFERDGIEGLVLSGGTAVVQNFVSASDIFAAGKITASDGFNGKCITNGQVWTGTCNQDVAETFATDDLTEAGDLVVFIPEDRALTAVQRSTEPYAEMIVGVVSTNPGLVFDQGKTYLAGENDNLISEDKTVVAMIGRVPTKFSLENGPVAVGDPLTSSSTPGTAMKATEAGRIIGYAMQSSEAAKAGKILVWLQPSTHIPAYALEGVNAGSVDGLAELQAEIDALTAQVEALSTNTPSNQFPWNFSFLTGMGGLAAVGMVFGLRKRLEEAS